MAFDDDDLNTFDPGDASLRASDAEREAAGDELRRHHGDGRLADDELEQRLGAAYRARTTGELRRLFADLPGGERRPSPGGRDGRAGWVGPHRRRPPLVLLALGAFALLSLLGALAGGLGHGPDGRYHHPPFFVGLIVAFVVWRVIVWRRRAPRRGGWPRSA